MAEKNFQWNNINVFLTEYFEYLGKQAKGEVGTVVTTGLNYMDDTLNGGFHPGDLIILASRPSMGKTSLAMNIALHVAIEEKKPVVFFSIESGRYQFMLRLLCSLTGIHSGKIRMPYMMTKDEWALLLNGVNNIIDMPLYLDDTCSLSPGEICERVGMLASGMDIGLIVIDYLQILNGESSNNPIKDVCRSLKIMAMEFNVPVVVLSQLNRKVDTRACKRPRLSDLRGEESIEEIADVVMFLYRDEAYNPDTKQKGMAEIIVAKQKLGQTANIYVLWDPLSLTFRALC